MTLNILGREDRDGKWKMKFIPKEEEEKSTPVWKEGIDNYIQVWPGEGGNWMIIKKCKDIF